MKNELLLTILEVFIDKLLTFIFHPCDFSICRGLEDDLDLSEDSDDNGDEKSIQDSSIIQMKKPPQSNEVDVSSESGSDASTSIDSSSDEGSKKESGLGNTEWSLDKFVKPDIQPKPVPAELTESNGSLASADSSSHKFTSPKRIKDQNKQNPNGIRYFPHQGRILNWFYFHQIISLLLVSSHSMF